MPPYTWDTSTPTDGESRRQGDDRIREIKVELRKALNDGPLDNFPTDALCTRGWPRIGRVVNLADLPSPASPGGRLYYVSDNAADTTKRGLWFEMPTGKWRQMCEEPSPRVEYP